MRGGGLAGVAQLVGPPAKSTGTLILSQDGATVYDSYQHAGFYALGGTSLASPIIAAVYALAPLIAVTEPINSAAVMERRSSEGNLPSCPRLSRASTS